MFFIDPNIKLIFKISDSLGLKEAAALLQTNKALYSIYQNEKFWQNQFGVKNYQEFRKIYDQLTPYPSAIKLLKTVNIKMHLLEKAIPLLQCNREDRITEILKEGESTLDGIELIRLKGMSSWHSWLSDDNFVLALKLDLIPLKWVANQRFEELFIKRLLSTNALILMYEGFIRISPEYQIPPTDSTEMSILTNMTFDTETKMLHERLITLENLKEFMMRGLDCLLSERGIEALRNRIFSLDDVKAINDRNRFSLLMNSDIFLLLREKFITFRDAMLQDEFKLNELSKKNGLEALRNGLITAHQAFMSENGFLEVLLGTAVGMDALRKKLITADQASLLSYYQLKRLITPNGVQALSEKLITPEQAQSLPVEHLERLMSDDGLAALREGNLTADEVQYRHARIEKQINHTKTSCYAYTINLKHIVNNGKWVSRAEQSIDHSRASPCLS